MPCFRFENDNSTDLSNYVTHHEADLKYMNMNIKEKMNNDLDLGGNKILNASDSESIVTKTYIENNLESRKRYVDNQLTTKVNQTEFNTELDKKVNSSVLNTLLETKVSSADLQNTNTRLNELRDTVDNNRIKFERDINSKLDTAVFNRELLNINNELSTMGANFLNYVSKTSYLSTLDEQNRKINALESVSPTNIQTKINNLFKLKEGKIENPTTEGMFSKYLLLESLPNQFIQINHLIIQRIDGKWFDVNSFFFQSQFKNYAILETYMERTRTGDNLIRKYWLRHTGTFPSQWNNYELAYSIL